MKLLFCNGLVMILLMTTVILRGQEYNDSLALEGVIVEVYYISDANDASDTDGGSLNEGAVTYRVYADLHPHYEIQAVISVENPEHELLIKTDGAFFNNADRGEVIGQQIRTSRLDENTVALDSWVTIGAASDNHLGIPKSLDTDGSIVGGVNNDGGSASIQGGLLVNDDEAAGIPLITADGLIAGTVTDTKSGDLLNITLNQLNLNSVFGVNNSSDSLFSNNTGNWYVAGGMQGATDENLVLLGQFTTTGNLECRLNLQLRVIDSVMCNRCGLDPGCGANCGDFPIVFQFLHTAHPADPTYDRQISGKVYHNEALKFTIDSSGTTTISDYPMAAESLLIYPNPASNVIHFISPVSVSGSSIEYLIFDETGKLQLYNKKQGSSLAGDVETIHIGNLPAGCYFLQLVSDKKYYTGEFIKK